MSSKTTMAHDESVICCETSDDATLAYMAMFRYVFGRMTYMPDVIIRIIKVNAATLTDRFLGLLDRELTEEAEHYERIYMDTGKPVSNYGHEWDRELWLAFHEWVKAEIAKRKGNNKRELENKLKERGES